MDELTLVQGHEGDPVVATAAVACTHEYFILNKVCKEEQLFQYLVSFKGPQGLCNASALSDFHLFSFTSNLSVSLQWKTPLRDAASCSAPFHRKPLRRRAGQGNGPQTPHQGLSGANCLPRRSSFSLTAEGVMRCCEIRCPPQETTWKVLKAQSRAGANGEKRGREGKIITRRRLEEAFVQQTASKVRVKERRGD